MPVESILMRLIIGCVQPLVTPGICSLLFNSLMISFFVIPFRHSFFGFSMTMVSIMLIGELSVAVFALPAFPNTDFTSGSEEMILSCTCKILFTSLLETSGSVTGINNTVPSSSGGINSLPRLMIIGMLIASAITLMAIVVFRHLIQARITGSYNLSKKRLTGLALSGLNLPRMKNEISTGASVTTRIASTTMIKVLVYANGWNNLPSCPVRRNTGRKDVIMMIVQKKTPRETC